MNVKAIVLNNKDNVATCTSEAGVDDVIECLGGNGGSIKTVERIPIWHKVALKPIAKGDKVIKYGEMIGEALIDIPKGGWVSHENIYSVPRDYRDEYIKTEA